MCISGLLHIYLYIFQASVNINDIIELGYKNYGFISNMAIERLRVKHRLRVVQILEDTAMKNTLRTVGPDCLLSEGDLRVSMDILYTFTFFAHCRLSAVPDLHQ